MNSAYLTTLRTLAVVGFVSGQIGTRAPVRYISAVLLVLVLAPPATQLTRVPFDRLAIITTCIFLIGVLGAGGAAALALMTYLVVLPAGRLLGWSVESRPLDRLAVSLAIALTQWLPIVAQYRNPALILDRLSSAGQLSSSSLNALERARGLRPVGTTVSPGIVAAILLAGVVVAVVGERKRSPTSMALWVLGAGHLGALVLTGSRAGLASAAVFLSLQLDTASRLQRLGRRMFVPLGVIAVYAASAGTHRVTASSRLDILSAAMPTLRRHWLSGVGWAATPEYVSTAVDGAIYHLHFTPVHVLFELGVLGFIACTLFVARLAGELGIATLVLAPFFITDAGTFINVTAVFFLGVVVGVLHAHRTTAQAAAHRAREPVSGGGIGDSQDGDRFSDHGEPDPAGVRLPGSARAAGYQPA